MSKLLAIAGSTSSKSINLQLARYAAGQVPGAEVTTLDAAVFDLPIYSEDVEASDGVPEGARLFLETIRAHDAVVISLAEHNGSYPAAFKNLYDWTSRIEQKLWSKKPMLLMASSPGGRGGATVLAAAEATFPRMGASLVGTFSLPAFYDNFDAESGIRDEGLSAKLTAAVDALAAALD